MPDQNWQPQIVAFVCQWCTYAGADLAGTSRIKYDPSVRVVKLPCSGRIDPLFLVKSFEQGADGVLVSGCHPGDCHYTSGNLLARRRFTAFRELLGFLGLAPERLQFSWVSAAEAVKWTEVVNAVSEDVRQLGPLRPQWGERPGAVSIGLPLPPPSPAPLPSRPDTAALGTAEAGMQKVARELLEAGRVNVIAGYGSGTIGGTTTPLFVTCPEDVGQLVWNQECHSNLSVYLTRDLVRRLGPVGIVTKGCDGRALVSLLQEHQISREEVTIIGVPCAGMWENGSPAAKCLTCDVHVPPVYDLLVEVSPPGSKTGISDPRDAELSALEALTPEERWAYWQEQFSRCVRCYACRAVCPMCYCQTCIVDKSQPQWIPAASDLRGSLSWNTVRAYHLAGRCIGCDECTRVCPANIRLDLINRKLALLIQERYGYRPGFDPDVPPPLDTFLPDDRAEFIR